MKREILFRGKSNSGKWVCGSLVYSATMQPAIYFEVGKGTVKSFDWCYVDPDTVGQYTGLCDKHGNKIFEGDIVRVYDWTSVYASEYSGEVTMYRGTWVVKTEIYGFASRPALCFDDFAGRKTEVIGNIYDKKEGE